MTTSKSFLQLRSVQALIEACGAETHTGTARHLMSQDFAVNRQVELRVLPQFGFGGKLYLETTGGRLVARASAYPEDEARPDFDTEGFEQVQAALAAWTPVFELPGWVYPKNEDARFRHGAPARFPDEPTMPTLCGDHLIAPGRTTIDYATCTHCRIARALGSDWVKMMRYRSGVRVVRDHHDSGYSRDELNDKMSRLDGVMSDPIHGLRDFDGGIAERAAAFVAELDAWAPDVYELSVANDFDEITPTIEPEAPVAAKPEAKRPAVKPQVASVASESVGVAGQPGLFDD